jgi:tetratricopeptide (TPR) repeat protein
VTLSEKFESADGPAATIPRGGIWRVPGGRNTYFTGRERVLGDIQQYFQRPGDRPAIQAIVGLGGIGKTQLAAEYAWRNRADYDVVWWLAADDATTLALSYAQLAERLGLRTTKLETLEATRQELRRALGNFGKWLLVFDNAPSAEAVRSYLPLIRSGHVLITSRDTEWAGVAQRYGLGVMERTESVEFLMRRVGRRGKDKSAGRVAQALGDHPLALEQAGAHIVESRIDFAKYLKQFESHWAELLARGTGLATPGAEYPDSLAMSLELTFRQLEESLPGAQALLNLFAFFAGESIPPWVLETAATISEELPLNLIPLAIDQKSREDALAALRRYSLVEADAESSAGEQNGGDLRVHRLVAALARRRLATMEKAELATASLRIVTAAFKFDSQDPATWPMCASVLPHALAAAEFAESLGAGTESAAKLLNFAGRFLMSQDRLVPARDALTKALTLARKVHGPFHARLAGMTNDLGRVLQKLGDNTAAREYFEKSLRIDENIYGDDDAHAASVMNNYAIALHGEGDLSTAREYLERALSACEIEYGAAHRRVAMVRNNLACVLRDTGDAARAREQFELALRSALEGCGEMHPVVARITFNLAMLLRAGGDQQAALSLLDVALRVDRHNLGPVHPDILRDLTELAATLRNLGEIGRAVACEEEARAVKAAAEAATPDSE